MQPKAKIDIGIFAKPVIHTLNLPPMGYKTLDPNSNNTEYVYNLDENTVYTATISAFRVIGPNWTIYDTDSQTITAENPTITLTVDLYWNGSKPDDPPAGH